MKYIYLNILIFCFTTFFTQEPGANFDFGKYEKIPEIVDGKLMNPMKKMPKDRIWFDASQKKDIQNFHTVYHPSKDILNDTTSKSINGEYVAFRNLAFPSETKPYTFYSNYVTNREWKFFERYVIDSISRRIISDYLDDYTFSTPTYNIHGEELDYNRWHLNWKNRIDYTQSDENDIYSMIVQQTYPKSERIDRRSNQFEVDARKIVYEYYEIDYPNIPKSENINTTLDYYKKTTIEGNYKLFDFVNNKRVNIYRDSLLWIQDTSLYALNNIEDGLVAHYNSHPYFENYPVTSINDPISNAYLHWLEKLHQKYLNRNNIPLVVKYSLPQTPPEVCESCKEIEIESFDLSNWKVTNKEYKEFVDYVTDSIAREIIAYDYEHFKILCYDEYGHELDLSECNLDYSQKIDWKRKSIFPYKVKIEEKTEKKKAPYGILNDLYYFQSQGDTNLIDKRKLYFEYYHYDFKTASLDFPRTAISERNFIEGYIASANCDNVVFSYPSFSENDICIRGREPLYRMKNLNLSYIDKNCRSTDIFSHEDRSQFILPESLNIYPYINDVRYNISYIKNGICQEELYNIISFENYDDVAKYIDTNLCPVILDYEFIPKEYDFDSNPDALIIVISYHQFVLLNGKT